MNIKILFIVLLFWSNAFAQQSDILPPSQQYEWPSDPLVKGKLEDWRDQKFGVIIHWGLYAVPGIIESWSLCNEEWINRDTTSDYAEYKKWYWGLNKDFNPVNFNPEQWATAAQNAGMKYLVFTTKHHDGFNMFDTKQTDFKITNGPFANHPKANVAKHVFDAFRQKDFMIGAYFSKPDWHSEYFWWPWKATPDRNPNYDITKYPWRWQKFKDFTYNQISELMHDYGSVDILWLDGGWVRPRSTVNDEVLSWGAPIPDWDQEVNMPKIATMAREAQPGILIVDRTVHGPYENYQTPEQQIPKDQKEHPWESCITLGGAWGFVKNDKLKPANDIIRKLAEIVAKNGNLLLGVGPAADGTLPQQVQDRLAEIGTWMKANGDAIYNTRTVKNYFSGDTYFTSSKDGKKVYGVYLNQTDGDNGTTSISVSAPENLKLKKISLLSSGKKVKWKKADENISITLPKDEMNGDTPIAFVME